MVVHVVVWQWQNRKPWHMFQRHRFLCSPELTLDSLAQTSRLRSFVSGEYYNDRTIMDMKLVLHCVVENTKLVLYHAIDYIEPVLNCFYTFVLFLFLKVEGLFLRLPKVVCFSVLHCSSIFLIWTARRFSLFRLKNIVIFFFILLFLPYHDQYYSFLVMSCF